MIAKLNNKMVEMYVTAKYLLIREEGQDLIEYALLVAMISLAAVAGMKTLGTEIQTVFASITTTLTGDV